MARTGVWARLCLLFLALQCWSWLNSAEGAGIHSEGSLDDDDYDLPFEKPEALKPPRRSRLYMEMRFRKLDSDGWGDPPTVLVTYECVQEDAPASINCKLLSQKDAFQSYKVANYYNVNRLSPHPAWSFHIEDPIKWDEGQLAPQLMLGIEPRHKLMRVFEQLSVDNLMYEKKAAQRMILNNLLRADEYWRFVDYFKINDLIVFSNNYDVVVLPGLKVFVRVVRRTVEAATLLARAKSTRSSRRQAANKLENVIPMEEVNFALLFLMEKMIDPCMVMEGDDYIYEGVATKDADYICHVYCEAIKIAAGMSDVGGEGDFEIQVCNKLSGWGCCLRDNINKRERVNRCWCFSETLKTERGRPAKGQMLWCHNLFRGK